MRASGCTTTVLLYEYTMSWIKMTFIYPNPAKEIPSRHYQNILININHNTG